jgi:hypothetical protein
MHISRTPIFRKRARLCLETVLAVLFLQLLGSPACSWAQIRLQKETDQSWKYAIRYKPNFAQADSGKLVFKETRAKPGTILIVGASPNYAFIWRKLAQGKLILGKSYQKVYPLSSTSTLFQSVEIGSGYLKASQSLISKTRYELLEITQPVSGSTDYTSVTYTSADTGNLEETIALVGRAVGGGARSRFSNSTIGYAPASTTFFNAPTLAELSGWALHIAEQPTLHLARFQFSVVEGLKFNGREGVRLSLPVAYQTGPASLLEGYVGYGFLDEKAKYGIHYYRPGIQLGVEKDIEEPGSTQFSGYAPTPLELQHTVWVYRMDDVNKVFAQSTYELAEKALFTAAITAERREVSFRNGAAYPRVFQYVRPNLALARYWGQLREVQPSGRAHILEQPFFTGLSMEAGIPIGVSSATGRAYFARFVARARAVQELSPLSHLSNTLFCGLIAGKPNKSYQIALPGNDISFNSRSEGSFETLPPTTFFTKRSVMLFSSYRIGGVLPPVLPFSPVLVFLHNAGVGEGRIQNRAELAGLYYFYGYYGEIGLGVDDLFRFPIPGISPSVGIALFMRYGGWSATLGNAPVVKFTVRLGS